MARRYAKGRFVSEKDLGWREIAKQIEAEAKKGAQVADVGWDDPEEATKAVASEFGTAHRSADPFIRPTFDSKRKTYQQQLEQVAEGVVSPRGARKGLRQVAEQLRDDIADAAPVDTGDLRDAIVIREGKS